MKRKRLTSERKAELLRTRKNVMQMLKFINGELGIDGHESISVYSEYIAIEALAEFSKTAASPERFRMANSVSDHASWMVEY